MNATKKSFYVSAITEDRVWIRSSDVSSPDSSLNAFPSWTESGLWYIPLDAKTGLHALLKKLRDIGFLFLKEPTGWPPAAIFEKLRSEGKLDGNYSTITFHGFGTYEIENVE